MTNEKDALKYTLNDVTVLISTHTYTYKMYAIKLTHIYTLNHVHKGLTWSKLICPSKTLGPDGDAQILSNINFVQQQYEKRSYG